MKIKKLFIAAIVIAPIIGCEPEPTALEKCMERINEQTDRCYFEARERLDPWAGEACYKNLLKEYRWCDRKHGAESK